MKKSSKSWTLILIANMIGLILITIIGIFSKSNTNMYLVFDILAINLCAIVCTIGIDEAKKTPGVSRKYIIEETANNIVVHDVDGVNKRDIELLLKQYNDYKASNQLFGKQSLFNIIKVRFKDDKKQEIVVDTFENTQIKKIAGYINLNRDNNSIRIAGIDYKIAKLDGYNYCIDDSFDKKKCSIELITPLVSDNDIHKYELDRKLFDYIKLLKTWEIQSNESDEIPTHWGVLSDIEVLEG